MTFEEKMNKAAEVVMTEKLAFKSLISHMVSEKIMFAEAQTLSSEENGIAQFSRELASEIATISSLVDAKKWHVGMTTKPGDIVLDPLEQYKYIYVRSSEMIHNDSMSYPGAENINYWVLIPETKNFIKVYPDIDGVSVSVKKGEQWWNIDRTQVFAWKGEDNADCASPPVEGNDWELINLNVE